MYTSAGIPILSLLSLLLTDTFTAKTWVTLSSLVWMFFGINSAFFAIFITSPSKISEGKESKITSALDPSPILRYLFPVCIFLPRDRSYLPG